MMSNMTQKSDPDLMRIRIAIITVMSAILICLCPGWQMQSFADAGELTVYSDLNSITKHGNVYFTSGDERVHPKAFNDAGIECGDIVTVSFLGEIIDMPVVKNFSEVPSGDHLIRLQEEEDKAEIAINYEDFASVYIADQKRKEDGTSEWVYKDGIEGPITFHIVLKEKGGWTEKFGLVGLSYTDDYYDYFPRLSIEEFANFRPIATTGIAKGILYRTASPVNPKHKRNKYADAALRKNGVKTIMNLADSQADVEGYAGYSESYYSTCNYKALKMGMSFTSEDFKAKLADGLRFFAENEGPYAVHCTEGKDRGGLISAILECFMGASYDEVKSDYMVTFYNYYDIRPSDDRYEKIAEINIERTLRKLFDIKDTEIIENVDLSGKAEEFFGKIGLSDEEMEKLRANLSEPQTTSITGMVPAKKSLTVKWKKAAGISGYQIQFGLKSSFKGAKTLTVPKAGVASKKIKKLKSGKKYYVRIRTYKKVNGKAFCSAWSAEKSAKVK